MLTLRFSVMRSTEREMALLQDVLSEFEATQRLHVDLIVLEWPTAWRQLVDFVTSGTSPDVSLVGTTWISPLNGMQVIRPFSEAEALESGGEGAYLPSVWNAGVVGRQLFAVPWQVDTRLIFYWRSALQRAGIAEGDAFGSFERLEQTVATLSERGEQALIAPTSAFSHNVLHALSAWIWSAGGDFLNPSADRVLFDQPVALNAIQRYFAIHRSLGTAGLAGLTEQQSDRAFENGTGAVTVSGPWIIEGVTDRGPEALDDLGIAPMPGIPYNGGAGLVIWRRSLQEQPALALIRHLVDPAVQRRISRLGGQLPARLDVLTDPEFNADRFFAALSHNALRGRALPNDRLWGVIEDRLVRTLGALWPIVLDPAQANYQQAVVSSILRLAQQLNTTLGH